jgi:hypothetical protein
VTQRRNFDEAEGGDLLHDLKLFYCDTATFGVNSANVEQALSFFAAGRVMFGTDTPMDMGQRGSFCTTSINTVEELKCLSSSAAERSQQLQALYSGNVLSMLGERAPHIAALVAAAAAPAPTAKL